MSNFSSTTDIAQLGDVQAALLRIDETTLADPVALGEDEVHVIRTPDGDGRWRTEVLDDERIVAHPRRRRGDVRVFTGQSFTDAVKRRTMGTDSTTVYVDEAQSRCIAVLNDDERIADGLVGQGSVAPGWRDDRVVLVLRTTPDWDFWVGHRGLTKQETFAAVIEEGQPWIVDPEAAEMLELAQSFEASISARFKKAGRINSGAQQLVYEETIDAKAGTGGSITIPDRFIVRVAPFYGVEARDLPCQIRYKITDGSLQIGYAILNLEQYRIDAFRELLTGIIAGLDGFTFLDGEAPSVAEPIPFRVS